MYDLKRLVFYALLLCAAIYGRPFAGEEPRVTTTESLRVPLGQSVLLALNYPIIRMSITDPEIADAAVTSPSQVLINGVKIGVTTLIIWDEREEYRVIRVTVHNEASTHQITLQVNFLEVTKNAFQEAGIDFWAKDRRVGGEIVNLGSFGGKVEVPTDPLTLSEGVDFFLSLPNQNLSAIIKALEEKKYLRVLARPNLTAINGEKASFLAGGEFPVPIVTGSAGMQSVSIQFKEYGIKLIFTPTVLDTNLVNLDIAAEVSSLDFENGITLSGFRIPSLVSRKTETVVELNKGEYLFISGLLAEETTEAVSRVPLLGSIPILGKLFTSKRFQDKETELFILVSPKVIETFSPTIGKL